MIQLQAYDYEAHTPASPGKYIILSAVRGASIANSKVFDFHIVACADLPELPGALVKIGNEL